MRGEMDLTLDVAEVQVLINYPQDPAGFYWHHRLLLHRVEGGIWICLTPDHDLVRCDLNSLPHRILERRSPFPPDIAAEVYAHDVLGKAQLAAFKRQARLQAVILGEGDVEEPEVSEWVVADFSHEEFGRIIDAGLVSNAATGVAFNVKGVIIHNGEEVFVERILVKELDEWRRKRGLETADARLLGDHKDASGKRRLELPAAVDLMKNQEDGEFPISGTRAAKEYHEAIASGPGNFLSYHTEWLRLSGVAKRSSAAHIHRTLCEGLRLMHSYDQIDASCTAIGEHLSRWAIQTEVAVERNPAQPDYAGLDIVSGAAVLNDGRAATSKFTEWLSGRMKERANIWKQERLFNQERRGLRSKGKGGGKGEEDSDDEIDSKKKKKKKKRSDKPGGGGDPPAGS